MTYGNHPLRHCANNVCLEWITSSRWPNYILLQNVLYIHVFTHMSLNQEGLVLSDYIDISFFFLLVLVISAWIKTTPALTFLLQWIKHTIFFQVLWDVHIDQDFVHLLKWKTKIYSHVYTGSKIIMQCMDDLL